jgi:hypothetical protein
MLVLDMPKTSAVFDLFPREHFDYFLGIFSIQYIYRFKLTGKKRFDMEEVRNFFRAPSVRYASET